MVHISDTCIMGCIECELKTDESCPLKVNCTSVGFAMTLIIIVPVISRVFYSHPTALFALSIKQCCIILCQRRLQISRGKNVGNV